jgi:hypothetical protein
MNSAPSGLNQSITKAVRTIKGSSAFRGFRETPERGVDEPETVTP